MCGIAGVLEQGSRESLEQVARRMIAPLRHRGPDDQGLWTDSAQGVALGQRRLSIVDLSAAGHQPMVSACGRFVIVFNGEIYNHASLRDDLDAHGPHAWRGHSDTETLLACFAAWGVPLTLQRAVGMFAIALWDRERTSLTLARDRIGEKPLYYGWQGKTFLFGSELKALRAHPGFEATIDRGALALFVRHNYVPAPFSIYAGIRKLMPGTYVTVSHASREITPVVWWSLAEVARRATAEPFRGGDQDATVELERTLANAVRGQMVADVPLGSLLSGGLDSTLVTAVMQANSPQPVRSFTIGFGDRDYDEARHAGRVAQHLGTQHTELRVNAEDALGLISSLPTMYDEPFADSSQLPTHLVMKLARQHVTVALSGDGGDEMFGGYNRYVHVPAVWQRIRWMPNGMRRALGHGLTALPSDKLNRWLGPLARRVGIAQPGDKAHKLGVRLDAASTDDLYLALVSEWREHPGLVLGAPAHPTLLSQRAHWPRIDDPVARMMLLDALTYLPDDVLVKVDRAAMAASLETRAPFLDRDVMAFAWSLPMHMKIRAGRGKWLLQRLLDRYVPRSLVERPKMGFGVPLEAWLRGPLRDWAEDLLDPQRLRRDGYLDPGPIRAAWRSHVDGRASNGYRLWSVLMFQAWIASAQVAR